MNRIKSFLIALLLVVVTAYSLHVISGNGINKNSRAFALWSSEKKAGSFRGITENLEEGVVPVFGSSEFQHGTQTPFHPSQVFASAKEYPMLIGAGYYQSLGHAVTLSAIAPYLSQKKAVLILSPQWFRKTGVVDQAYISRFSEKLYIEMLKNSQLSKDTKSYITKRTGKLLKKDEKTLERVKLYERVFWKQNGTAGEQFQANFLNKFLTEKDGIQMWFQTPHFQSASDTEATTIPPEEWEQLMQQAEAAGEQENTNPLWIDDKVYEILLSVLDEKKDMNKDAEKGYQTGPEFDDLACFLQVCQELEIEPMLVIIPVNGYYYDHTGFPKTAREAYYQKIRDIAEEYQVAAADFSDQEYTKYFFEDRVHIGKKGWVMVNESIYQFCQK